jgi:hypothetical protein
MSSVFKPTDRKHDRVERRDARKAKLFKQQRVQRHLEAANNRFWEMKDEPELQKEDA